VKNIQFKLFILLPLFLITGLFCSSVSASVSTSAAIGGAIIKQFKTGKLKINKIIVEKPHIFKEEELRELLAKYEGREITVDELKGVQGTLSKYYFETGYVNSGVIIPNQSIKDGVIRFKAIHGRLTRVKISGNQEVSKKYIYGKLRKGISVPLNSFSLQKSLIALRQDPLIADVKAHIKPGESLGQSILQLKVKEKSPYFLNVETNNHRPASIGQYGLSLYGGHRNIFGLQDTLQADLGIAEGLKDAGLSYSIPLGFNRTRLFANYDFSTFEVVDSVFGQLGVEGSTSSYGAGISHPIINNTQLELSVRAGMDVRKMKYSIAGDAAREPNSSPVYFALDMNLQRSQFAAALSAGARQGLKLGLFEQEDERQEFTTAIGQMYLAFSPMPRVEWVFNINGQVALDELPAVEKFAMGGAKSVRGYKENIYVRDSGLTAVTQIKYPIYRSNVFVVPFVDYGRSWEKTDGVLGGDKVEELLSAGIGMQWNISKAFYSELFWGKPFIEVDTLDDYQQDSGFHFLLNYKIY